MIWTNSESQNTFFLLQANYNLLCEFKITVISAEDKCPLLADLEWVNT